MLIRERVLALYGVWLFIQLLAFAPSDAVSNRVRRAFSPGNDKVIHGNDAYRNEFPFVVYTNASEFYHGCTGSLIHRQWVLTAAHCLYYDTHVVLGDYNRPGYDVMEQVIPIAGELEHPDYNLAHGMGNDIGLIKLAYPANVSSDAVATLDLIRSRSAMSKMMANKKSCKLLGWGLTKTNDGAIVWTSRLQEIRMRIVNRTEQIARGYDVYLNEGMVGVEAVYTHGCRRGGSCAGDSGSPLVCRYRGRWVQTAVHAYKFKRDGCIAGVKGETNVQLYYDWIQSVINGTISVHVVLPPDEL